MRTVQAIEKDMVKAQNAKDAYLGKHRTSISKLQKEHAKALKVLRIERLNAQLEGEGITISPEGIASAEEV